jgi:hypothetical protein
MYVGRVAGGVANVEGYFPALFFLKSFTKVSFGGGGVIDLRCCAISNADFGLLEENPDEEPELEEKPEEGLLLEEEKPVLGFTALGLLLDENPELEERLEEKPELELEERLEEKPDERLEENEERLEENPFASASITGNISTDIATISSLMYFFIMLF